MATFLPVTQWTPSLTRPRIRIDPNSGIVSRERERENDNKKMKIGVNVNETIERST